MSDPSETIIERMKQVRSKSSKRVADISSEAGRLTDWREYVRSAPMTAFMMSITIGAIGARALVGTPVNQTQTESKADSSATSSVLKRYLSADPPPAPQKGVAPKLLSTLISLAMPLIINTARSQISRAVSNFQSNGVRTHGK